ncbi:MAG: TetR/AcrR family transcriptional regulator [Hyphomicrobiaceae bacterium]|nr:MAG: TetR/AcrR family transcriptional regulator [Hyphomicrobiaceae bacterium]
MIETSTYKGRAAAAMMRLAETRPWNEIALLDIAAEAGISLEDLMREGRSKAAFLGAFAELINAEQLKKVAPRAASDTPRDRLFDAVMTRFDLLAPYRAALKRIEASAYLAPELIRPALAMHATLLAAAGIPAEGPQGAARLAGLAAVYSRTFRTWLEDDDPGLAKTMAALDRRLRRGERWLRGAGDLARAGRSFIEGLGRVLAGRKQKTEAPAEASKPAAATATPTNGSGTSTAS